MLKKYIAREPKVDVVPTSNKDDATIAVAGVIYQNTDPELGEVPDLEGYNHIEKREERRDTECSGQNARDGSSEIINVALPIAHRYG